MLKAGFRKCHRRPENRLTLGCELRFASSSFRWLIQMRFLLGVQNATKHCISRYRLHTVNAVALLLIAKKNVHLKLKRDRGGVHEINLNVEDSMVNITTLSLNWKQMENSFFSILEWILRRSPTFWGRLKINRCTADTHETRCDILYYNNLQLRAVSRLWRVIHWHLPNNWGKNTEKPQLGYHNTQ